MPSSPVETPSVAFVYIAHYFTRAILREYKKIESSVTGLGTPWFLYQGERNTLPKNLKIENIEIVDHDDILALGYRMPSTWVIPGSTHFPLLHFYKNHPGYHDYWLIEYDVRFSGNWRTFFGDFANIQADFLAAHLRRYRDEPDWPFWELTHPTLSIALEDRLRCFHPICRFSNPALECICSAHQEGWYGHDELLPPTLLQHNGFSLVDFGGEGEFVLPGRQNKYYTPTQPNPEGLLNSGTLRYRPPHPRPGREKNKLYHPIKPPRPRWKEHIRTRLDLLLGKSLTGKIISFLKQ